MHARSFLVALAAGSILACSGSSPDASSDASDASAAADGRLPPAQGGGGDPTSGTPDPTFPPAGDAGAPDANAATDASDDAAAPPSGTDAGGTGVFAGAPAYAATLGPSTRKGAHKFGNATQGDPAGAPCLTCHRDGGSGPAFTIAGTVYAAATGAAVVPSAEVRLVDAKGAAVSVYTDALGNFFLPGPAMAVEHRVGARADAGAPSMVGAVTNGNCNGCHNTTTVAHVHVP